MAYDSVHNQVVLYGGFPNFADTWTWDGAAPTWIGAVQPGVPGVRYNHGMAYDSARSKTVLFGGSNGTTVMSDTWEFDGASWTQVATTGPGPRYRFGMAYDSARSKTVLFGGYDASDTAQGDTWEWDGAAWTQVATTGPSPRGFTAMAYDASRGRTVLYGGAGTSGLLSDTWEWDGSVWTQIVSLDGPGPREQHAMATDNGGSRVLLYGGSNGSTILSDTWLWNGAAWTLAQTTSPPGARSLFAMTYDSLLGQVVLFGGVGSPGDKRALAAPEAVGFTGADLTWLWSSACDDQPAVLDAKGNVVFPSNLDTSVPAPRPTAVVDDMGVPVVDLYPAAGSGLDNWYPNLTCNPSIGGTQPSEASLQAELQGGLKKLKFQILLNAGEHLGCLEFSGDATRGAGGDGTHPVREGHTSGVNTVHSAGQPAVPPVQQSQKRSSSNSMRQRQIRLRRS